MGKQEYSRDGISVLLPYGSGSTFASTNEEYRTRLQKLGATTGYGLPPVSPWAAQELPHPAHYVFVPQLVTNTFQRLHENHPENFPEKLPAIATTEDLGLWSRWLNTLQSSMGSASDEHGLLATIDLLNAVICHFSIHPTRIEPLLEDDVDNAWFQHMKAIQASYERLIVPLRKNTFVPRISFLEDVADQGSRYHGTPWIPDAAMARIGEAEFLFQIDCDTLPLAALAEFPEVQGKLLSFFAEDGATEGRPFLFNKAEGGCLRPEKRSETKAGVIVGWVEAPSFPCYAIMETLLERTEDNDYHQLVDGVEDFSSSRHLKVIIGGWDDLGRKRHMSEAEFLASKPIPDAVHVSLGCDRFGGWPDFVQGDDTPNGGRMLYQFSYGHTGALFENGSKEEREAIGRGPHYGRNHLFLMPDGSVAHTMACD